jgi:O-antigen ligase
LKTIKYISFLIALVAFNQIFVLTPAIPQNIYYAILTICLIIGVFSSKRIKLNPLMVWLLFAALISLVVNDIPTFFQAPLRLLTFTLVVSLIGPFINSEYMAKLKVFVFYRLNRFIAFVSTFSFLIYFGLPVPQIGGFSGFFNHSMALGPMAGISLLFIIYSLINNFKNVTKRWKRIYYIAIVICFLVLLLSSSRAAIAGTVTGLILYLYKYFQARFSKFLTTILFVVLLVIITFPAWSDYTEGIQIKQKGSIESEDFAYSRRAFWNSRLEEFKDSPVFGIGFSVLDITKQGSSFQKDSGSIEPGSSWLAILSMIGIVGFIPVFFIFYSNLRFLLRDRKNPLKSAVLLGLLIFFITHMFAEGYIFASGSFLCLYIWLLIAIIEVYKYDSSLRII